MKAIMIEKEIRTKNVFKKREAKDAVEISEKIRILQ